MPRQVVRIAAGNVAEDRSRLVRVEFSFWIAREDHARLRAAAEGIRIAIAALLPAQRMPEIERRLNAALARIGVAA